MMTDRMGKFRRLLRLVHLLADTGDGLTLDEMAHELEVTRRTAERMRDIIDEAFGLEVTLDDRRKRFRIPDGLRRVYTRPNAAELAALETEVDTLRRSGAAQAPLLASLLGKVKAAFDDREKRRLDPDLDALARLQRGRSAPGPLFAAEPERLVAIQGAILAGRCVEFDYRSATTAEPRWRCVIPHGIIHGPISYLLGGLPATDEPPAVYRLDRMTNVRGSDDLGLPSAEWDLDEWMVGNFGIWREDTYDVVLRVAPDGVERASSWCFHPNQTVEAHGDEVVVRFQAGGLREMAEHLFTWGGLVFIEGPDELRQEMGRRLKAARRSLRPPLS